MKTDKPVINWTGKREIDPQMTAASTMLMVLLDLTRLHALSKASKTNPNTTFVDTRDFEAIVSAADYAIADAQAAGIR